MYLLYMFFHVIDIHCLVPSAYAARINFCRNGLSLLVLCGCETLSLKPAEECKFRVLRRIFGPKGSKVVRDWRRLPYKELHKSYASPIITTIKSKRMRWTGHEKYIQNFDWKT
jgi:hypothetical protein